MGEKASEGPVNGMGLPHSREQKDLPATSLASMKKLEDRPVMAQSIESAWGHLWSEAHAHSPGLMRTRTLTLVALARQARPDLIPTLEACADSHPSRMIALVAEGAGDTAVELCGTGGHGPDSEMVCVTAPQKLSQHWAELILPLLVPELPVYLWVLDMDLLDDPECATMLETADHLILDTGPLTAPEAAWAPLARWSGLALMDLSWVRLNTWRAAIAAAFDTPECLHLLGGLSRIEAAGGIHNAGEARWLQAWLGARLADDYTLGDLPLHYEVEPAAGELHRVTLTLGPESSLTALLDDHRVDVTVEAGDSILYRASTGGPDTSVALDLAEALHQGYDPVFASALKWLWDRDEPRQEVSR